MYIPIVNLVLVGCWLSPLTFYPSSPALNTILRSIPHLETCQLLLLPYLSTLLQLPAYLSTPRSFTVTLYLLLDFNQINQFIPFGSSVFCPSQNYVLAYSPKLDAFPFEEFSFLLP